MNVQDDAAKAVAERLLHGAEAPTEGVPEILGFNLDELQQFAMFITTVVFNEIDRRRKKSLRRGRREELHELFRSAVYSALYARQSYHRLASSREFVDAISALMPRYYQPARLISALVDISEK